MNDWVIWFGLAGGLLIFEMFTGTFYLLMLGLGFAAGGLVALLGASHPLQLVVAALVGIAAIIVLRRNGSGLTVKSNASRDPNVNLDIGQTIFIDAWDDGRGDVKKARAMYRGAMWDVELAHGAVAHAGTFVIREIRGNHLIVADSRP